MRNFYLIPALWLSFLAAAQPKIMSFEAAKTTPHSAAVLDKTYKSALHNDINLAVFKTEQEQTQLIAAYTKLLQDFGTFLRQNHFSWKQPQRCFNRIYLSKDGKIEYFLYQFKHNKERPEDNLTEVQLKEFERLLNLFVLEYRLDVTASEPFAQCSPVVYQD